MYIKRIILNMFYKRLSTLYYTNNLKQEHVTVI